MTHPITRTQLFGILDKDGGGTLSASEASARRRPPGRVHAARTQGSARKLNAPAAVAAQF
jgi:hypothetical protein